MFRTRQPLRRYFGAKLSHTEYQSTDDGVEKVTVDDCSELPPCSDFDLELNLRAGENVKEVSTILLNNGKVNLNVNKPETAKEQNDEE